MIALVHSGAMRSIEPKMCNGTSGNLEIPGSRNSAPLNDNNGRQT
jgi:hypothetical protein